MRQPSSIHLLGWWAFITGILATIIFFAAGMRTIAPLEFSEQMIRTQLGVLLLGFLGLLWFVAPIVRAQPRSKRPLEGRKRRLRFHLRLVMAVVASVAVALWAAIADLRAANKSFPVRILSLLSISLLTINAHDHRKERRHPQEGPPHRREYGPDRCEPKLNRQFQGQRASSRDLRGCPRSDFVV
jgi:hypothetical protein